MMRAFTVTATAGSVGIYHLHAMRRIFSDLKWYQREDDVTTVNQV